MTESRFQRWSRRKTEARTEEAELPVAETAEPELSAEEQELAVNEELSEEEVLAKYDLPDPDNIALGTDITGFMKREIPEVLRRKALRSLWKSNPVLAVLDGLNDYDEDFNDVAVAANGLQTLYKVGQGMIDRSEKAKGVVEVDPVTQAIADQSIDKDASVVPPEPVDSLEQEQATEYIEPLQNPEEPVSVDLSEPPQDAAAVESTPRYRPRMHFDF